MATPVGAIRYHIDTLRAIYQEVGSGHFAAADVTGLGGYSQRQKGNLMNGLYNRGFLVKVSRREDGTNIWKLSQPVIERVIDSTVVQV